MCKKMLFLFVLLVAIIVLFAALQPSPAEHAANKPQEAQPTWVPFRAYPVAVPETIPPGDWVIPIENFLRHKNPVTAGSTWLSPYDEDRWMMRGFQPIFAKEEE